MVERLLPIGIQDFEDLRKRGCVYIDKTAMIYKLTHEGKPYFLSRPRRFGKSLLISTLEAYFLGKKDLFKGLAIEKLEKDWFEYPVLKFSLASGEYTQENGLRDSLSKALFDFENKYLIENEFDSLPIRFANDLQLIHKKTGRAVVVLVDEYDNPLLKNLVGNQNQSEENRILYKGFFSVLKDQDAHLQFVLFTGVTKFSKVSIFSDLNQLNDISLNEEFASICGITQNELEENFVVEIESMATRYGFTKEDCLNQLKRMYDGYHFCMNSPDVYNPFSLLNAFYEKSLGSYWFSSGTPTFLVNKLNEVNFDIRSFENFVKIEEDELKDYGPENPNPVPLLYQSGYLTIKDWNFRQRSYKLGFPNDEVKYGFLKSLAPTYLKVQDKPAPFNIDILDDAVEEGDTDGICNWFTALFALLPYPASGDLEAITEQSFQNVIYISLLVIGKYCRTEVHSAKGRADCVVETPVYIYIFEFKRDGSAADALKQIEEQGYAKPYAADKRKVIKVGVNFSSGERNIVEWEVK